MIVNALAKYDDPRVIETLLHLAAPSECDCYTYAGAVSDLSDIGDERVLDILKAWAMSRPDDELLNVETVVLDVRLCDDPIELLAGFDSAMQKGLSMWPSNLRLDPWLVDRCTAEQLTASLAEEKYANIWPFVYGALVARRAMDEGEAGSRNARVPVCARYGICTGRYGATFICTLTEVGGMSAAKANASMARSNGKVSVTRGATSMRPEATRSMARS